MWGITLGTFSGNCSAATATATTTTRLDLPASPMTTTHMPGRAARFGAVAAAMVAGRRSPLGLWPLGDLGAAASGLGSGASVRPFRSLLIASFGLFFTVSSSILLDKKWHY